MNFHLWKSISILLVLVFLSSPAIFAQSLTTGDIVGTLYDPTHAVVPNVTVTLKSLDTGTSQTTTSNAVGFFTLKLLKPGRYEISAKAAGFAEIKAPVTVIVGQSTTADLTMPISQSSEIVEVTGVAPVVTQTASVNTSYTQMEVAELPSAGGDITNIAQTAPGAVMNVTGGYGNFTVNGLPATSNLFTVNGENNMDPTSTSTTRGLRISPWEIMKWMKPLSSRIPTAVSTVNCRARRLVTSRDLAPTNSTEMLSTGGTGGP